MRLTLNEDAKKFIDFLDEADRLKLVITEDAVESNDAGISDKFREYVKARLAEIGDHVRVTTEHFRAEHPEYFE